MEESRKYDDLPEKLQLRLQARFAFAVENRGKDSKARGDKRIAHDHFSAFKQSVLAQQAMEARVLQTGTLYVEEEEGLKQNKSIIGEGEKKAEVKHDKIHNDSKAKIVPTSSIEGKKLLVFLQKLRFVKASLAPLISELMGHLYLISKDYGVCADQILFKLEQEVDFGEKAVLEVFKALEEISSSRDNFAKEVQSLTKVVKALTTESARDVTPAQGENEGLDTSEDACEEDEYGDSVATGEVESKDGSPGTRSVRGGTLIASRGHIEGAQRHLDRTRDIINAFTKSADELTRRAERRRAHEEKHEQETREAKIQRVREDFLAQGKHKAKLVQHHTSGAAKKSTQTFDYRERRRQAEEMEKRLESEESRRARAFASDRGDEHDRSEAALAVVMLEEQVRILNSQLEVARWHAMTPEEQRRITEERNRTAEEVRLRVERTKAMSVLKLSVIAKFQGFVERWKRNKATRKEAAFNIIIWYRFHDFMRRVRSRVKTKHTSEYLAVVCYQRVILPRRNFLAAVKKLQRFLRGVRFKFVVKKMFRHIVTAALEKCTSAVKMRLDPVRAQLGFLEKHVLALSPSDAFGVTAARLEGLRLSTETAANVSWSEVSPLVHGTKHADALPIDDEMPDEVSRTRQGEALWSTVQDIWSDAAQLKKRVLLVQSRAEFQRIATRCATRLQYLSDRLANHLGPDRLNEDAMQSGVSSVNSNPISPMHGETELEEQSFTSVLGMADTSLENSAHVQSEATVLLPTNNLVPKVPQATRGILGTSRARAASHHIYLRKVEPESYQPTPPLSAEIEKKSEGTRGARARSRKVKVAPETNAPIKEKVMPTSAPTGVQEMMEGDDGEDDDAIEQGGARFKLMMDHGAKVQKEVLLAKLLRLKRVLSSRLHSYAEKEAHIVDKQRERRFVIENFSREAPVVQVQRPTASCISKTERNDALNIEPGSTGDGDLSSIGLKERVIIGDCLLSPASVEEVQQIIASGTVRESVRTTRTELAMWTQFSMHLCSRVLTSLAARGLYPTPWQLTGTCTHTPPVQVAISPLGYVPDISVALSDEVLRCYLLLESGKSPTTFATGRGGLNLFSKKELLSSAKPLIPPKESRHSLVEATLRDSSRAEAVHHASELCLSGLLTLPASLPDEPTLAPSVSHLVALAAERFPIEMNTDELLKKLVVSLSAGDMSMFRRDAGSFALDPALQVLALLGFFATKNPPEWSIWLTSIEGRLTERPMETQDLAMISKLPHADAGAALAFLCHVMASCDEFAEGDEEAHLLSVAQALRLVQILFGVAPDQARSPESLLYYLSVRAHAPKSVWRADTEFSTAVAQILLLAGVEVNCLEFRAPVTGLVQPVEVQADRVRQRKGPPSKSEPVTSTHAHISQSHRSTMRVGTLQHDLATENSVGQGQLRNVMAPLGREQEESLCKALTELNVDSLGSTLPEESGQIRQKREQEQVAQFDTGLAARHAALFGNGHCEIERGGLLLPAHRRKKPRMVNPQDSSIQIADEFGEVHNFDTQDYAAMQEELDFVYLASVHKARVDQKEQTANEEPRLLIRDAELYATKCTEAYGVPIAVYNPSSHSTDLRKAEATPKKLDTWFRGARNTAAEDSKEKKDEKGELTLFEAQQLLKRRKENDKKKRKNRKAAKKAEEDEEDEGRVAEHSDEKSSPALGPGQVSAGKAVENESFFLENVRVSRFAVALCLLPFHLHQRRRVQRMVRLNEAWRAGEGHLTGVLDPAHFHDVVMMLVNSDVSIPLQPSREETDRAWVSASVNDVMEFSSFCAAIDSLDLLKM